MSLLTYQTTSSPSITISTAQAFYRVFRALPKPDRMAVARYIIEDEEVRDSLNTLEIPNQITLDAFAEDKSAMPQFESIDELRKDLLA